MQILREKLAQNGYYSPIPYFIIKFYCPPNKLLEQVVPFISDKVLGSVNATRSSDLQLQFARFTFFGWYYRLEVFYSTLLGLITYDSFLSRCANEWLGQNTSVSIQVSLTYSNFSFQQAQPTSQIITTVGADDCLEFWPNDVREFFCLLSLSVFLYSQMSIWNCLR